MIQGDFTFEALMESCVVAVNLLEGMLEAEVTFRGQLEIAKMKGRLTTLGECCILCMLYLVHSVLSVCCTWCNAGLGIHS
jgi:hypothetical protein